jgi:hypothetical protein
LTEDTLDRCDCNVGYKGTDPTTRQFRRLMFKPPIREIRVAWRTLEDMEAGTVMVPASQRVAIQPLSIQDAFQKYGGNIFDTPKSGVSYSSAWVRSRIPGLLARKGRRA